MHIDIFPTTEAAAAGLSRPHPRGPVASPGRDEARAIHVAVAGELDIATVPALDEALRSAERAGSLVILDLRELEFMDSSGAHLMLAADRRIRRSGGRLVILRGPAELDRLLALTGFGRELDFADPPIGGAPAHRPPTRVPSFSQ